VAEPSGNPPGPPHDGEDPFAGDKIDAPAACAVPFRPYCGGVVTRTQNVSEYMLVLALCLVETRRPASADRTARAANFRRDLEAT